MDKKEYIVDVDDKMVSMFIGLRDENRKLKDQIYSLEKEIKDIREAAHIFMCTVNA